MKLPYFCITTAIICLHQVLSTSPLWPQPQSLSLGDVSTSLSSSFQFIAKDTLTDSSNTLQKAFKRYEARIFRYSTSNNKLSSSGLSGCTVTVANVFSDEWEELNSLDLSVDESYSLSITTDLNDTISCDIQANTVWGGLNALETFTQLLQLDESSDEIVCQYLPVTITDYPRYSHRGILIDTSRHYLPLSTIISLVDSLSLSKINVLHWHMVDAESFPFDSPSEPDLVKGAYTSNLTYTSRDIKRVTAFAAERGVRIIFEVDVPGHAGSWVVGKPELLADCLSKYSNVENYALNPSLDETYSTINGIMSDLVAAQKPYNTKYIHMGGDEVIYGCWKNDASITSFMLDNGISSYDDMLGYFVNRTDVMLQDNVSDPDSDEPVTLIHWEEVFFAGATVPSNTIFQVWTDASKMASVADGGNRVLASPSDYWYLNYVSIDWQTMYSYEPTSNLTESQQQQLIGGEACLWGELVDEMNLESVVYPRLSAVGERLWSSISTTDEVDAKARLTIQRCRLIQLGFKSAAVQPNYCYVQYI